MQQSAVQKARRQQPEPLAVLLHQVAALGSKKQQDPGIDVTQSGPLRIHQRTRQIQRDIDGEDNESDKAVLRDKAAQHFRRLGTPARDGRPWRGYLKLTVRANTVCR